MLAATYHLLVVLFPALGDRGTPMRHGLFVVIDFTVGLGVWKRPRLFFWILSALGVQQLYSHGRALVSACTQEQRFDWISVLVLLVIPLALWILWQDYHRGCSE